MEIEEFEKTMEDDDFSVGNSFWLGNWEFEVVNKKKGNVLFCSDETVFKWELTKDEFIHVIRNRHPEIKDPEEFFRWHEDEIIHYFQKGFDALVGECGATYETIMEDAINMAIEAE